MAVEASSKTKYTHLPLGQEVEIGIGGYYVPYEEVRLPYKNREVLYVIGQAVVESSCCNTGNWKYTIIPGFIESWKNETSEAGLPVSGIELIRDEETQIELRHIIQEAEDVLMMAFW